MNSKRLTCRVYSLPRAQCSDLLNRDENEPPPLLFQRDRGPPLSWTGSGVGLANMPLKKRD
jgi:hypothetical protein